MPIGPSYRPIAEPEHTDVPAITEVTVTESPAAGASPRPRWRRVLPVAFGAATVILGALGAWAAVEAHDLRANAASANDALVDASTTRTVTRDIRSAVNTIFSYSYADTARTKAAAQRLLTGPAIRQYNQLFALVQQDAPKEKLVVTTHVQHRSRVADRRARQAAGFCQPAGLAGWHQPGILWRRDVCRDGGQ